MAAWSKQERYDRALHGAQDFLLTLKQCPSKQSGEYTRLLEALEEFIAYGYFGDQGEDE